MEKWLYNIYISAILTAVLTCPQLMDLIPGLCGLFYYICIYDTPKIIIQTETSVLEKNLFNTGTRKMVLTLWFCSWCSM